MNTSTFRSSSALRGLRRSLRLISIRTAPSCDTSGTKFTSTSFSRVPIPSLFHRATAWLALLGAQVAVAQTTPATNVTSKQEPIITLEPFAVETTAASGYGVSTMTTSTRLNTPLRDIPSTISVVTADFMADIAAVNFDDAITYMPAVTPRQNVSNGAMIRGLMTTRQYQNNFLIPSYVSDMGRYSRIEIIKGPASAITGRGEPGGVINYTTKKPPKQTLESYQLRIGSNSFVRGEVDRGGPLVPGRGIYYRAIAIAQSNDLWRDFEDERRIAFFPSVYWELANRKTNVLVEAEVFDGSTTGSLGTQFLNPRSNQATALTEENIRAAGFKPFAFVPRKFQMAEPGATDNNDKVASLMAFINHRFNDIVSYRQSLMSFYLKSSVPFRNPFGGQILVATPAFLGTGQLTNGVSLGDIIIRRGATLNGLDRRRVHAAQGDLLFEYKTPRLLDSKHATLLSYELTNTQGSSYNQNAIIAPINLNNPIYGAVPTNPFVNVDTNSNSETLSYFVTQQTNLLNDRVVAVYGFRYDDANSRLENRRNATVTRTEPPSTQAQRWGLVVKPLQWLSLYYVNSDQEDPKQVRLRYTGLPPDDSRANELVEFGRKGKLKEWGGESRVARRQGHRYPVPL